MNTKWLIGSVSALALGIAQANAVPGPTPPPVDMTIPDGSISAQKLAPNAAVGNGAASVNDSRITNAVQCPAVNGDVSCSGNFALAVSKLQGMSPGPFFAGTDAANLSGILSAARLANVPADAMTVYGVNLTTRAQRAIDVRDFGSDSASDPTSIINNVLATYAGKAPIIISPFNTTYVVGKINWPSNAYIIVNGYFKAKDGLNDQFINANGQGNGSVGTAASNLTLEVNGTIDGNRANQTGTGFACINVFNGWSNLVVKGFGTVTGCKGYPLNAWNIGTRARVSDVTFSYSGNSVECAKGVSDCVFERIRTSYIDDYGACMYGGVKDSAIRYSFMDHSGAGGVCALNDGGSPDPDNNVTIAFNYITYSTASAVAVLENAGGNGVHTNVQVIGNIGHHNNQGNLPNYGGSYINGVTGLIHKGNVFHDDGNGSSVTCGIRIAGPVSFATFEEDELYNEGQGGTTGVGICNGTSATRTTFRSEHAFDTQTTKTMAFGCNGAFGSLSASIGNKYENTIGAGDNCTKASDTVYAPFSGLPFVPKLSAAPTVAPGAGQSQIFVTAGTNSGTCKVQMLAGTSTTPVTIVDNVGSGC